MDHKGPEDRGQKGEECSMYSDIPDHELFPILEAMERSCISMLYHDLPSQIGIAVEESKRTYQEKEDEKLARKIQCQEDELIAHSLS